MFKRIGKVLAWLLWKGPAALLFQLVIAAAYGTALVNALGGLGLLLYLLSTVSIMVYLRQSALKSARKGAASDLKKSA